MKTFLKNTLSALFVLSILWLNIGAMEPEQKSNSAAKKLMKSQFASNTISPESKCPICLEMAKGMRLDQIFETTCCRQFICKSDFQELRRQQSNCPLCRKKEWDTNPVEMRMLPTLQELAALAINVESYDYTSREEEVPQEMRHYIGYVQALNRSPEEAMAWAIRYSRLDLVKELLRNGLDINTQMLPSYGWIGTPLEVACGYNYNNSHYRMIRFLLENGADMYVGRSRDGYLAEAQAWGVLNAWYLFLDALKRQNLETAELFLSHGLQISKVINLEYRDANVMSGLNRLFKEYKNHRRRTSSRDYLATAELFLKYGIQPDIFDQQSIFDESSSTPIHDAILDWPFPGYENVEYIHLILRYADINHKNRYGITPLMAALCRGNLECARLFIKQGANLHLKDREGKTAWDYACAYRNKAIQWELFKAGGAPKWLYAATAAGAASIGYAAYEWLFKKE